MDFNNNTLMSWDNLILRLFAILNIPNVEFFISNHCVKYFLVNKVIPNNFTIVIYLTKSNNLRLETCIQQLYKQLTHNNVQINKHNKRYIKFTLSNLNFYIKERDNYVNCDYYFEINHLEYDIADKVIVNTYTKNKYVLNSEYINTIIKSSITVDWFNDCESLKKLCLSQPLVIFELIEFNLLTKPLITKEISDFLNNLNSMVYLEDNYDENDDMYFYIQLIKLMYKLEESKIYNEYINLILDKYSNLVSWIFGIKIKKDLFKIFPNKKLRDIVCVFVFQYLIYSKKSIYKNQVENPDLLETFMKQIDEPILNETNEFNEFNEFNILEKRKMSSLKYLKENVQLFVKFEKIISNEFFTHKDQVYIKYFYNFQLVFFTNLKQILNHHTLKVAYAIKRFHYMKNNLLVLCVKIFNHIIIKNNYNTQYLIKDNFYSLISSKKINDYIHNKLTLIPEIKKKFNEHTDCINIINYQDTLILFLEFLYINLTDYDETKFNVEELDLIFEGCLCDMRSYCILSNEKRRKKEKKEKKQKKEKKESAEKKYQIIKKNNLLNNQILEEESDNKKMIFD
jgi:hypothetical protein